MKKILTVLWVIFMIVLTAIYNHPEGLDRSRASVGLLSWLVVITFPSSIVLAAFGFLLVYLFGNNIFHFDNTNLQYLENYIFYTVFGVVGYVQWFVIVPKLFNKFKKWKSQRI